jgi:hypothetical protein
VAGQQRQQLIGPLDLRRPLDVRHHERESGDVQDTGADITLAGEALGFRPRTDLRTGLAAEFEWVLERTGGRRAMASTG